MDACRQLIVSKDATCDTRKAGPLDYCVIIPTRNRSEFLRRAVRSVLAQTVAPAQIIIVDDASELPVDVSGFTANVPVTVLRQHPARGGAASRNVGLQSVQTQFVGFLDDDDEWLPTKMEEQLKYFAAHPESGLVSCGHWRIEAGAEYEETFTDAFVRSCHQYDNFFGSFSFLCVRRALLDSGVMLDQGLAALQDWDFALRCLDHAGFGVIEKPLVRYHAHEDARITTGDRNRLRGLRRFYFSHRTRLCEDARRWHLARVAFERGSRAGGRWRVRRVLQSVAWGWSAGLPLRIKARTLGARLVSLFLPRTAIVKIRARALAVVRERRWHGRDASQEASGIGPA